MEEKSESVTISKEFFGVGEDSGWANTSSTPCKCCVPTAGERVGRCGGGGGGADGKTVVD